MGGINVKNTMIEALLQNIAPHPCFGCGKIGTTLCHNCKYNITSEPFVGCILCQKVNADGICVEHDVPICKAWVVSERVAVLKRIIDAYKFENVKRAAHTLVDLLDTSLPLFPSNTMIVPIPTASSHVRQRGYDHAHLLSLLFAQRRGLSVAHLLQRSSSKTQHRLNKTERQQEAKSAFHVISKADIPKNTPVVLLDDIITTGSTLTSASIALREAGATNIFVAALAYQPLD